MTHRLMTPSDVTGAWAIIPTPAKDNASDWRATNTVDLDETARVVNGLIEAGINGILSMGTLGEAATMTQGEKLDFIKALVDAAASRVPIFVSTTCLNTRNTVTLTRQALELGADGAMLGVPVCCTPSLEVAVQFYKDVAEAVPEMNIAIYANPEAFKFEFSRSFWGRVADIPQVVTAKYIGVGNLLADLATIRGRIKLLPIDFDYYAAARMNDSIDAFWSSGAVCCPLMTTTLRDVVLNARATGNWKEARAFQALLGPTAAPLFPNGSFKDFATYNIADECRWVDESWSGAPALSSMPRTIPRRWP